MSVKQSNDVENDSRCATGIDRRDLLKMSAVAGVGAVLERMLDADSLEAQSTNDSESAPLPPWGSLPMPTGPTHRVSSAGFKLSGDRAYGMAPYDDVTRTLLEFAESVWQKPLLPSTLDALGDLAVDAMSCIIAGFESDAVRASARVASQSAGTTLKSTVLGYGVTSTVELATHTNCCMVRHNDWSDNGLFTSHYSDSIPGVIAAAEAFHVSGLDALRCIALAYELIAAMQAPAGSVTEVWDTIYLAPAACMAIGKMLKMNDDQLANAFSLSLATHLVNNVSHSSGPLSMMKACHNASTMQGAINSILLAREGMTGPPAPFQGTKGLYDVMGRPFKVEVPVPQNPRYLYLQPGMMVAEAIALKRYPAEGGLQTMIVNLPQLHKFASRPEDIDSVLVEVSSWGETGDPAKWDPQNEETADHSMAYVVARGLLDGEITLASFTRPKFTDPAARAIMAKLTIREIPGTSGSPRVTVRKTSGEAMTKGAVKRVRMTHEEVMQKFNTVCDYKKVNSAQRDRIREQWLKLQNVASMVDAVKTVAKFGEPRPLSDRKPNEA
jgi:2-methylcitrate dehydratase